MRELGFILIFVLFSYVLLNYQRDYQTKKTRAEFTLLKKPATMYYKKKMTFWWSTTIRDADGKLHEFSNISIVSDSLGDIYNIGDTIK